ncbi:MAG: hypothetical protein IJV43_09375 [Oscillospiraceae bacterium]|nr:hypothetical protein [Oscillospiraceae bacterium]
MAGKSGVSIRSKKYEKFRGVDFSTDPALVDDARSPWAPNMIADMGGMPEKRPGWRTLLTLSGQVNGLFSAEFGGVRHLLAHAGSALYRWYEDGTSAALASGLQNERSVAVFMGDSLWIFTGAKLLRYNGTTCTEASESAYVPLTIIARTPSGGGVSYESVNLLTGKQKIGFLADGTSTVYKLPYESIDSVDEVAVNGTVMTSDWSADMGAGTVTFTTAPDKPSAGAEDNVFITFTKTIAGYADRINKCTTAVVWGAGAASDRIIATGNPDYPNQDYTCGYMDGTYWPDTGYAVLGTSETKILGYRRLGEYLAIVKEDNGQDSTVFLRSGYVDENGETVFSAKPCLAGAGAVTRFGFGNIGDEQLILTGGGVYALTTNSLTAERIAQNRSYRVDPKLRTEALTEAVTCSYDGMYLVFVGGRVYGLDGRQPRSYPSRNDTSFLYECFYWENVPARCVLRVIDKGSESLYFGVADGRVCRFNTDVEDMTRFSDDGAAIEAVWSTKADDDGDPMVLKTMLKKGNAVTIKPYTRSSAKILFRTDRDTVAWQAAEGTMDIFDWEDIDFNRFTFNSNDAPAEIPFRRKVKNYKRLQILVKNNAVNEGFGVFCIVKHFVTGNFAKK